MIVDSDVKEQQKMWNETDQTLVEEPESKKKKKVTYSIWLKSAHGLGQVLFWPRFVTEYDTPDLHHHSY